MCTRFSATFVAFSLCSSCLPMSLSNLRFDEQVEESFGACLGAVLARLALADKAGTTSTNGGYGGGYGGEEACGGEWEHVDLFSECGVFLLEARRPLRSSYEPPPSAKRACACSSKITGPLPATLLAAPARHDANDKRMAMVFRRVRRRLERLRRCNRAARFGEARRQVAAILHITAAAGCRRLATATARLLRGSGYLPSAVVDEVELLLDAAEAIWASGRCVV